MMTAEPVGKTERPRHCCSMNGTKMKSIGFYGYAKRDEDRCQGFIYGAYLFGRLVLKDGDDEASFEITNTSSLSDSANPCSLLCFIQLASAASIVNN